MSKSEHMGISPSQVNSQTGNSPCPKQTTLAQMCEFSTDYLHHEPLESKDMLGSEAVENGPREIRAAEINIPDNEKLQAFCGEVPESSITDHLVIPPEDVSTCGETNNGQCSQQNTLEQKNEFGKKFMDDERSEQAHHLSIQIEIVDPGATSLVDNSALLPVSEDASKSSLTEITQALENQSPRFKDLHIDCVRSEPFDQMHNLGCKIIQNESATTDAVSEDMPKIFSNECSQSHPREANDSCQAGENSQLQPASEQTLEFTAGILGNEPFVENNKVGFELGEAVGGVSCSYASGESGPPFDVVESSSGHSKQPEDPIVTPATKNLQPSSDLVEKNCCLVQSETPPNDVADDSACLGSKGYTISTFLKKGYKKRSSIGSDRVLRSRCGEKPKAPESINNATEVSSIRERKRKKPKNIRGKKRVADEYSRIRSHLRYLLNRINYEKSLIAAYSSEGWKGLSIEKLKPEKELQRATSEILRRKLKIRDLFQHLDSSCAGGFPKSLFDSEGQIDSEDIYCATCGSKDLSTDNDIILCDGACDRGFHQYCLEPPLLKEDIPPDDEGWLCPGCDCKVDCIDLVNEVQGTRLLVTDNWEKVFPEAAAGHNQDPNFGLPSDDSDDNDYDPDGPTTGDQDDVDKSNSGRLSSNESDFTSACDEEAAQANDDEHLGIPSEDSDDDEYDPDAPELDENAMQESSSSGSDFTSDSEDLAAVLEDNRSSGNYEGAASVSPLGDSKGQISKLRGNKESLNNEQLSIVEPGQGCSPPVGKRSIERLDYKTLYDDTYGNVPSDSSDDEDFSGAEDWSDDGGPRKRKKRTREGSSASLDRKAPDVRSRKSNKDAKENLNETEHTSKRRGRRKLNSGDANLSIAESHEGSSTPGSQGKRDRTSYRRLGEDVIQKLLKSFKENQYPDRRTKESLAKEIGLTLVQVSKWFDNTRWAFNHPSSRSAPLANSEKSPCTPQSNKKTVGRVPNCNGTENVKTPEKAVDDAGCSSGDVKDSKATPQYNNSNHTTRTSKKRLREGKSGDRVADPSSNIEVIQCLPASSSPKVKEVQTKGRTRRR